MPASVVLPANASNEDIVKFLVRIDTKIDTSNRTLEKLETDTKDKFNELIETVKGHGVKIKEIEEEVIKVNEIAKTNEKKVKKVEMKLAGYEDNTEKLKFEIEQLKAKEFINDVTIAGIERREGERLEELFNKLCNLLQINTNDKDTIAIYRSKGSESQPGLIIVKFKVPNKKFEFIAAKRRAGEMFAEQILHNVDSNKNNNKQIFLNHHITPYFNNILYKARQAKAAGKISTAWANSSGVFYKINEGDAPKRFQSATEIEDILGGNDEQRNENAPANYAPSKRFNAGYERRPQSNNYAKPYGNGNNHQQNRQQYQYQNARNYHNKTQRNQNFDGKRRRPDSLENSREEKRYAGNRNTGYYNNERRQQY